MAIVNRAFAERFFNGDAMGRQIRVKENGSWATIVGVAPVLGVVSGNGDRFGGTDAVYVPLAQSDYSNIADRGPHDARRDRTGVDSSRDSRSARSGHVRSIRKVGSTWRLRRRAWARRCSVDYSRSSAFRRSSWRWWDWSACWRSP